jgi:hypothetical protein
MPQNQLQPVSEQPESEDVFGFSIDDLRSDALAAVQNPHVRNAILRVKQGRAEQGFVHDYDKAYHSHSST